MLNRFQGWGVGLTAESIALRIAVKYCGSGKGRQGVAEPTAPLFTPGFATNNAADRGGNASLHSAAAYGLSFD